MEAGCNDAHPRDYHHAYHLYGAAKGRNYARRPDHTYTSQLGSRLSWGANDMDDRRVGPLSRKVLIADDSDDIIETMSVLLDLLGYEVVVARDGHEALTAAEQHRPSVALLDIGMPGIDGYELARQIRARPWGRNMRLVAVTGYGRMEDKLRAGLPPGSTCTSPNQQRCRKFSERWT